MRGHIVCVVLIACARPVRAQAQQRDTTFAVRGIVTDSTGRPLESVEVGALLVGRFSRTDADGHFVIGGLPAGRTRLRVRRLGWLAIDTTVVITSKSPADTRFMLAPVAQNLLAIHIVSQDECPTRTLEGFECRRRAGIGAFRDSAEIAALKPYCQEHVIDGMVGLRLVPHIGCPLYESTVGWRCLVTLYNGLPPGQGMVGGMKDYVGVEYYADYRNAPEWYKQYAFEGATKGTPTHQDKKGGDFIYRKPSLGGRNCSLVVFWSHFAPHYDPKLDQSSLTTQVMRARRDSSLLSLTDSTKRKPD